MRNTLVPLLFSALACLPLSAAHAQTESASTAPVAVAVQQATININNADAETLSRELKGVGPSKAQAIVDYRTAQGQFASVDELLEVKGIGAATLERIRHQLTVD